MTAHGPLVNVLYGSVTGNAEEIARNIHALLPKKGFEQGLIRCLADHADVPAFANPREHRDTYNVIVVSTTGDGDPPETIRPFMRLMRSKDKTRLEGLNFAVLGLGDTNYENFCKTGKRVDTTLPKLGAVPFLKRGDADDGVGLELVVEPWKESLWDALSEISEALSKKAPKPEILSEKANPSKNSINDVVKQVTAEELGFNAAKLPAVPTPKLTVESVDISARQTLHSVHPSYTTEHARRAAVNNARLLTAKDADKVVWHLEVSCDISSDMAQPVTYGPGDAFGLLVENEESEVERFLSAIGANGKEVVLVRNLKGTPIATAPVKRFVSERIDLRATPSKVLLLMLSEYCKNIDERRNLIHLSSREGRRDYTDQVVRKQSSILAVMETLAPSCEPPLSIFLDLLPAIPLRWYSATSSPELDGHGMLHFAFSVVKNGLATNALARRCEAFLAGEVADPLLLLPRDADNTSCFKPPSRLSTHYIMVGPGTGVAPFRGFLREREAHLRNGDGDFSNVGKTMLFFGCRQHDQDFLYEDDLKSLVDSKALSVLDVAFSREGQEKVYVQDRLLARRDEVAEIIRNDGHFFVCGDGGGMASGVHKALASIITDLICDGDEAIGKTMLFEFAEKKRYVRDIWYHGLDV